MKKIFTLSSAIVVASVVAPVSALEADQKQTAIDASTSISFYSIAQSFTPSASDLKAVRLNMLDAGGNLPGADVYLTLHSEDVGNPVIAQTEPLYLEDCFNFSEGPGCNMGGGTPTEVTFEFVERVELTVDQPYVFAIHSEANPSFNVAYSYSDSYSDGALFKDGIEQPQDLAFTTLSSEVTSGSEQDSILVSADNTIYRYAYSGELLDTIGIPLTTQGSAARDIIAISETKIAVFNGIFTPTLSVFDGSDWQHAEYEGWSIANNVSYGGIAATEDYIFVGDMSTGTSGAAQGIVRFTANLAVAERFLPEYEFIDLTMGEDGLLYGLTNTYGDLLVINSQDMSIVSSLDLGHTSSSRAVAADADGVIYLAAWNGVLSKFDASGQLLDSVDTGSALGDLDIQQGKLLASSVYNDTALLYSTQLEPMGSYQAPASYPFAAFSYMAPEVQEPEPIVTSDVAINSDWGSGYCANLVLTNTSAEPQTWNLELEVEGAISSLWGANWSQSGSTLAVSGLNWNGTLQPGQSNNSVGFCATR